MSQINEGAIKTPGVYVNEIPSFPPSVAQVATAIPAFIGYTQKAMVSGKDVTNQAVRISSLVQYVQYFGEGPDNLGANVFLDTDGTVSSVDITPTYQMFNSIRMFFNHGGSNCYIISVGAYQASGTASLGDFITAGQIRCFEVLKKIDEPTLIVVPDAVMLGENEFNSVMVAALQQCADLQDRFTIMDVYKGDQDRTFNASDVITKFRDGIGTSNLNYGAAYYPWLRSSLQYNIHYASMKFFKTGTTTPAIALNTIISNTFLTQLDTALSNIATPPNPLTVASVPFAGGVNPVSEVRATGIVTITAVGAVGDTYLIKHAATAISTSYAVLAGDTLAGVATALAALVTLGGYSATAAGAVITITAPVGTGSTPNTTALICTVTGTATATGSNFAGGVAAAAGVSGSCAATININAHGVYTLLVTTSLPNPTPIAVYTSKPGDTTSIIAGKLAGAMTGGYSAIVAGSTLTITAPTGSGAAVITLKGTLTISDDILNNLELQLESSNSVYANIKSAIKNKGIIVPPSGAIAGVYASVDATRGVWKAPANVSLNTVIAPTVVIDDNMQEDLNIDVNAGKSVNAIRAFTGKGVLVWGARTLEGNSNDWRYISVRRFYIMVEESVKKAAFQFVFEPNDGTTWTRVRAMIENYLTNLWRQGALAGPKPEVSFYVKVGLGQTMTFQDVLEGKMIIEIGMAPVRPAEFIILRFSQIQQQA